MSSTTVTPLAPLSPAPAGYVATTNWWGGGSSSNLFWLFIGIFLISIFVIWALKPQFAQTRNDIGLGIPGTINWGTAVLVSLVVALVIIVILYVLRMASSK